MGSQVETIDRAFAEQRAENRRRLAREVAAKIVEILRDPVPVEDLADLLEVNPDATIQDLADLVERHAARVGRRR